MTNPYSPPESDVDATVQVEGATRRLHPLKMGAIWLIFVLCVLHFWAMLHVVLSERDTIAHAWRGGWPICKFVLLFLQPTAVFLGGVFLLFRRKLAVLCFGAWLLSALGEIMIEGEVRYISGILCALGAIAFILHLRKIGELR